MATNGATIRLKLNDGKMNVFFFSLLLGGRPVMPPIKNINCSTEED